MVDALESAPHGDELTLTPTIRPSDDLLWEVSKTEEGYRVKGKRLETMVSMTDLTNRDALRHLHRRMERMGVIEKLREMGVEEGDSVEIGEIEFAFSDAI